VIRAAEPGKTFKIVVFEAGHWVGTAIIITQEALYRYRHKGAQTTEEEPQPAIDGFFRGMTQPTKKHSTRLERQRPPRRR
jgi:hypothetical protein